MNALEIAPSILSFDLATLSQSVPEVIAAGADIIHLDVMDGQFVPPITFGDALAVSLRRHTDAPMEAHLMTETPERQFEPFVRAGCRRIIFHAEATHHSARLIDQLHEMGVEAGIAINPGTTTAAVEEVIDLVDLVLIMTVNPGWGGQAFLPRTLDKVKAIRYLRSDLPIQVDGGITPETLPAARDAGATSFVVGSRLLRAESLTTGIQEMRVACDSINISPVSS